MPKNFVTRSLWTLFFSVKFNSLNTYFLVPSVTVIKNNKYIP